MEAQNKPTFIDLFAGAGGFSEGFLQAEHQNKAFDFILASDINENCELTHKVRYNHQLGLDVAFIRQDITEPDFLDNLLEKLNGKSIDVVCGGPPCQSFSLAGRRSKYDKKDDLFSHYLSVIRRLRPKYFVMENVKGILTKENGKIKEMILSEIKSIIDLKELPKLQTFVSHLTNDIKKDSFLLSCYLKRFQFEKTNERKVDESKEEYIQLIESKFKQLTPKIFSYKSSKTDARINTIRHGLSLLKRSRHIHEIKRKVINEKNTCNIDNDFFVKDINKFLEIIEPQKIVLNIKNAFKNLNADNKYEQEIFEIVKALEIYLYTFDECISDISKLADKIDKKEEFENIIRQIRLYNIGEPYIALASKYGVPQNRERVLFIGCRKDQKLITQIEPTVSDSEKVTVFEALYDLDFLINDDESMSYNEINLESQYNGTAERMTSLIKRRTVEGKINEELGLTYAEWSRQGRFNGRFPISVKSFYAKDMNDLSDMEFLQLAELHNHKTSNQNTKVLKRLKIILNAGDYRLAKEKLKNLDLDSDKRSYHVLKSESQSPTIMTMPDDYIHYHTPRALTVREMARLQSFDDSFVFQGKRSTGGDKRKNEVPQYTLVGNAIPPLMARAIGIEILKNIE